MPRAHNTAQQYDVDYKRILGELDALESRASDDIFQTSASPLDNEQLPPDDAIDFDEDAGYAACVGAIKDTLQTLLPLEQEVRPAEYTPPQLMDDLVEHFRLVVSRIPMNEDPVVNLHRERSELAGFIDDVWTGTACHFPTEFLRRLWPHIPVRWDMDCKLAKCLIKRGVCDEHDIPLNKLGFDDSKQYCGFKDQADADKNPVVWVEMFMISVYLARLSITIAAWLPYELMLIAVQEDQRVFRAFITGARYDFYLAPLEPATFSSEYWHLSLGHVIEWLEHRNWYLSPICSNSDFFHDLFWAAIMEGVDDYAITDILDLGYDEELRLGVD
ncbi:MAG: hypothetical protein L6R41_002091 [Letrouitia leprolyta]|nr:MAG: hypothetical protein L6R41_002091 [Letrouitia leprolyta]